jgi:hypothetical protein
MRVADNGKCLPVGMDLSAAVKYGRMRLRNPVRGEGQPAPERKPRLSTRSSST